MDAILIIVGSSGFLKFVKLGVNRGCAGCSMIWFIDRGNRECRLLVVYMGSLGGGKVV